MVWAYCGCVDAIIKSTATEQHSRALLLHLFLLFLLHILHRHQTYHRTTAHRIDIIHA